MENLANMAAEFGINLTRRQLDQFKEYYERLIEKNKVMNLTAIIEKKDVMLKHFLDSLSIAEYVQFERNVSRETSEEKKKICLPEHGKVLDMGTGAGFPGIPLKIAFPETEFVLADSLNKRIVFLGEVIKALSLEKIQAVHARAEELGRKEEYRESFDLCVSRAVANLSVLAEYCLPFVKVNGYFISYKAGNAEQEIEESKKAISVLGGKLMEVNSFRLPQSDIARTFVMIKKIKPTGKKYPRNAGKPAKEPIE